MTLLEGREHFDLAIGNYQRGKLKGTRPKAAVLVKRKDGSYYLNIVLEQQAPKSDPHGDVLGVDLGRTDIVVTSKGDKFSGKDIQSVRDRHAKLRQSLQSKAAKGTRVSRRSCRRLLKRLSGREARFQRHTNHVISKKLVHQAKTLGASIAVEDLTGIRERTNQMPRSKTERRRSNPKGLTSCRSWAFFQLRQFLGYKALAAGVQLMLVNPAYTSKTCHSCYQIGERQGKWFECVDGCGWSGDADLNGARNIRILGLLVNQPEGSESSFACACEWPRTKAHAIAARRNGKPAVKLGTG